MKKFRILIALIFILSASLAYCADVPELLKANSFYGSCGTGFMGIDGKMNRVWTNGYEIEAGMGYSLTPNISIELAGLMAFTSMAEDLKMTVAVVDSYGSGSTRTTMGGIYVAFPLGVNLKWQVPGSYFVLSASGGGNLGFESETGLDNIKGYTPRGTLGFGYYWDAGVYICDKTGTNEIFKYGLKFRFMENQAGVKDFYNDAFGGTGPESVSDIRYMLILDIGSL